MSKIKYDEQLADLNGSEQHHNLKNQPGDAGDPDHTETKGGASGKVKSAVKKGPGDTQMAKALREAVENGD